MIEKDKRPFPIALNGARYIICILAILVFNTNKISASHTMNWNVVQVLSTPSGTGGQQIEVTIGFCNGWCNGTRVTCCGGPHDVYYRVTQQVGNCTACPSNTMTPVVVGPFDAGNVGPPYNAGNPTLPNCPATLGAGGNVQIPLILEGCPGEQYLVEVFAVNRATLARCGGIGNIPNVCTSGCRPSAFTQWVPADFMGNNGIFTIAGTILPPTIDLSVDNEMKSIGCGEPAGSFDFDFISETCRDVPGTSMDYDFQIIAGDPCFTLSDLPTDPTPCQASADGPFVGGFKLNYPSYAEMCAMGGADGAICGGLGPQQVTVRMSTMDRCSGLTTIKDTILTLVVGDGATPAMCFDYMNDCEVDGQVDYTGPAQPAGAFSISPMGQVAIDPNTGHVDVSGVPCGDPTVTYTVTYTPTDPDGCVAMDDFEYTPPPCSGNPTLGANMCAGDAVTPPLTVVCQACQDGSTLSVNWYSTAISTTILFTGSQYVPQNGDLSAGANFNSNTPGTYTYFAECLCGDCGSDRVPVDMVVGVLNEVPQVFNLAAECRTSAILGSSDIITRATLFPGSSDDGTLTASVTQAYTGGASITAVGDESVIIVGAGCFEVEYGFPNGCVMGPASATAYLQIGIEPEPAFDIPSEVCFSMGDIVILQAMDVSPNYNLVTPSDLTTSYAVNSGPATMLNPTTGQLQITGAGTVEILMSQTYSIPACGSLPASTCTASTTRTITVASGNAVDATFSPDIENPCIGEAVTLTPVNLTGTFTGDNVTDNMDGTGTFTPAACGTTAVTYVVSSGPCQSIFVLNITTDQTSPVLTVPADDQDECGADDVADWLLGVMVMDNCPGVVVANFLDNTISGCGGTEAFVYRFEATDGCGNVTIDYATYTIVDMTPPVISTPSSNLMLECNPGGTEAQIDAWLAANGNAVVADGCGGTVIWTNDFDGMLAGGCNNRTGTITVTFTATDECGNSISNDADIIIDDTLDPTITCPSDLIVECGDPNTDAIINNWLASVSGFDQCDVMVVLTNDYNPATASVCLAGVATTVTFTATDDCNNTTTCTATIKIQDTTAPYFALLPQDTTIECNPAIHASAQASYIANNGGGIAADDCTNAIMWSATAGVPFDVCDNASTIPYTFTIMDDCGNSAIHIANFIIKDQTAPVITIPAPMTVACDGAGNMADRLTWIGGLSYTDDCATHFDIDTILMNIITTCEGTKEYVYQFVVGDECGNSSFASASFFTTDMAPPTITNCPSDLTLECGANNQDAAIAGWLSSFTASDICSNVTLTNSFSGSLAALSCDGTTGVTVTFTATDDCGNVVTCTADIILTDTENPAFLNCPSDFTVDVGGANCNTNVNFSIPAAIDQCDQNLTVVRTMGPAPGSSFAVGTTTTIEYTATDDCGNTATCSFDITIIDTGDPVISCPGNITICATPGSCEWTGDNQVDPVTADCNSTTLTYSIALAGGGSATGTGNISDNSVDFPLGLSTVTYTITETANPANFSTCMFTVTVEDCEPPTFTCPTPMTVECDGTGNTADLNAWLVSMDATALDDCDATPTIETPVLSLVTPGCGGTQILEYLFTITDDAGNSVSCTSTFTIEDTTDPLLTTPASSPNSDCVRAIIDFASWINNNGDAIATESCGNITWTNNYTGGFLDMCGNSVTVIFTATDDCDNSITTTGIFTTIDNDKPTITCPQDITLECESTNNAAILQAWLATFNGVDDCTNVTLTNDFVFANVPTTCVSGANTLDVMFIATDECTNADTCVAVITIVDNTNPVVTVQPIDMTVQCDGGGNTTDLMAWLALNANAMASDNCTAVTWSNVMGTTLIDCPNGSSTPYTFTATDLCGNSVSAIANFIIEDTTPPGLMAPANQSVECGNPSITTADWRALAMATDNCNATPVVTSILFNTISGCGMTMTEVYQFTATDGCGNETISFANYIITDTGLPVITCPANLVLECGDINNNLLILGWLETATAVDPNGCSDITITNDFNFTIPTTDCAGITGTVVTFTATDDCGNSSTCTATIIVDDTLDPEFVSCPDDLTINVNSASCTANILYSIPVADDQCDQDLLVELIAGPASGALFTINQTTTVTYRATDDCGNQITCSFDVTVVDNAAPTIVCPPAIFQCNDANMCTWEADASTDPIANDCSALTITYTVTNPDASTTSGTGTLDANNYQFEIGSSTVQYTVTDALNNTATCFFAVIIEDCEPPVLVCPSDPMPECGTEDVATWLATSLANITLSDNCGTMDVTVTAHLINTISGCGNTTTEVYQFRAVDLSGNITICEQTYTIVDNIAPVINTATGNKTVECDANGNIAQLLSWIKDNGEIEDADVTEACGSFEWKNNFEDVNFTLNASCNDDLGYYEVDFWTVDECGKESSPVSLQFIIEDSTKPNLTAPEDIQLECGDDNNEAIINNWLRSYIVNDVCSQVSVVDNYNTLVLPATCIPSGNEITVEWTATDDCGNDSIVTATITIIDTEKPIIMTAPENLVLECADPDYNTKLNTWVTSNGNALAIDNCNNNIMYSFSAGTFSQGCGNTGIVPYVLTVTDECGNSISRQASLTITDTTSVVITPSTEVDMVACDGTTSTVLSAWLADVSATDSCPGDVVVTTSLVSETEICDGTNTNIILDYQFIAVDECGNQSVLRDTFTIVDDTPPTITAPSNLTMSCGDDYGLLIGQWLEEYVVTEACQDFVVTNDFDIAMIPSTCDGGTYAITWTVVDGCGATATITADIIITEDTDGPVFSNCPAGPITVRVDQTTVDATSGKGIVNKNSAAFTNLVTELIGFKAGSFSYINSSPSFAGPEALFNEIDDLGASTFHASRITNGQDWGLSYSLGRDYLITNVALDRRDNVCCIDRGEGGVIQVLDDGVVVYQSNTVTGSGVDFINADPLPSIVGDEVRYIFENGIDTSNGDRVLNFAEFVISGETLIQDCSRFVVFSTPTATDCNGPVTVVQTSGLESGSEFPLGTSSVTFTATDICGNTSTCTFDIVVIDDSTPSITCPSNNVTVCIDAGTCGWISDSQISPTGLDNCDDITIDYNISGATPLASGTGDAAGVAFSVGTSVVQYIITDAQGLMDTCSFNVIVTDCEAPVITICPAPTIVECDGAGNISQLNSWLSSGSATDNCDGALVLESALLNTIEQCGATRTLQYQFSAIDAGGNTISCISSFTIEDDTVPDITASAKDTLVECDGDGNLLALNDWLTMQGRAAANEICGDAKSEVFAFTSFADPDQNPFQYTDTDVSGVTHMLVNNAGEPIVMFVPTGAEIGFMSTIIDPTSGVGLTDGDDTGVNAGTFQIADSDGTFELALDPVDISTAVNPMVSMNLFVNSTGWETADRIRVYVVFEDASEVDLLNTTGSDIDALGIEGNNTLAASLAGHTMATVKVEFTSNAEVEFITVDDIVFTTQSASSNVTWANQLTNVVDACGDTKMLTYDFIASDDCGNKDTTAATFTIVDTTNPALVAPSELTLECGATGNAGIINNWLDSYVSSDICGSVTVTNDFTTEPTTCVAPNDTLLVTWTATDACGNDSLVTSVIRIIDTQKPMIMVPPTDIIVECESTTSDTVTWAAAIRNQTSITAIDNCDTDLTISFGITGEEVLLCGNTKTIQYQLTVEDDCGNSVTQFVDVIIKDETAPTLVLPAVANTIACNGATTTALNTWLDDASGSDGCGSVTVTHTLIDLSEACNGDNTEITRRYLFTARDECGNETTGEASFVIEDNVSPTIVAPPNLILPCVDDVSLEITQWLEQAVVTETCQETTVTNDFDIANLPGIAGGNQTVTWTVVDGCGATSTSSANIVVSAEMVLTTPVVTNANCDSQEDGSVVLGVTSGGASPYTYSLSTGEENITGIFNTLASGGYTYTVTDNNDCIVESAFEIDDPSELGLFVTGETDADCGGAATGSATVMATGGVAPYDFEWSNGQMQTNIADSIGILQNVMAGLYTVTVTDQGGCTSIQTVEIEESASLNSSLVTATDETCATNDDGTATVSVTGGVPPYSYMWSAGATANDATGQGAIYTATDLTSTNSPYSVTITDINGCMDTIMNIVIGEKPMLIVSATSVNPTCFGGSDGTADATVSGGTIPYIFTWSNGSASEDPTGLSAGMYTLLVTDANGCTAMTSVTLNEPAEIIPLAPVVTDANCDSQEDGSVVLGISVGGATPFIYEISTGESVTTASTSQSFATLAAGGYAYTITDNNGCEITGAFEIDDPNELELTVTNVEGALCNGDDTGTATVDALGGTGPYTFAWSGGSQVSTTADPNVVTGLAKGTYTVTVTDDQGCQEIETVVIDDANALDVQVVSKVDVDCNGNFTGLLVMDGTGGTPPYSFATSAGSVSENVISSLPAGAYTVTITDDAGCIDSTMVAISENPQLALTLMGVNPLCNGRVDGEVNTTPSGGDGNYSYLWSNGSTDKDLKNVEAGTYTVTLTDGNGCTIIDMQQIINATGLEIANVATGDADCVNGNAGDATINISMGAAPFIYTISTGATQTTAAMSATFSGLDKGFYTFLVVDAQGCEIEGNFEIDDPIELTLVVSTVFDENCDENNDGRASVTASGGASPYAFTWSGGNPATNNTDNPNEQMDLAAGTYTVTVVDAEGCDAVQTVVIREPIDLNVDIVDVIEITCNGANDASIIANTSGGVGDITFSASQGTVTGNVITGLGPGPVLIIATDENGCMDSTDIVLVEPAALTLSLTPTNPACASEASGSVDAVTGGGTPNYSYLWNNGSTDKTILNVGAGAYMVTVTDMNGCTIIENITITDPPVIALTSVTPTDANCDSQEDGSVEIRASGGTGATLTYALSNGISNTSGDFVSLASGGYTYTIRDANNCELTGAFEIDDPNPLRLIIETEIDETCYTADDGMASVRAEDGTTGYTFVWSGGAMPTNATTNPSVVENLAAGTYQVTVTDAGGCTAVQTVEVEQPDSLSAIVVSNDAAGCRGENTGVIVMDGSGGTAPYSFTSPSGTVNGNVISELGAGTYTITITDANGCTETIEVEVTQPAVQLALGLTPSNPLCAGGTSGSITATETGGTEKYHYQWSNGSNDRILMNVGAGTYQVIVFDANGCMVMASATLVDPTPITLTSLTPTDANCDSQEDGEVIILGSGGTGVLTYMISTGESNTSGTFMTLASGGYTYTITDENNCSISGAFEIDDPSNLELLVTSEIDETCDESNDGTATVVASGGTPAYLYNWSNGATTATASNLMAGTYTVTVTDGGGCTAVQTVEIEEPQDLSINVLDIVPVDCKDAATGEVLLEAIGGVTPYTYSSVDGVVSGNMITTLEDGSYTITVTDGNLCTSTITIVIPEPALALSVALTPTDPLCNSGDDGMISAMGSGGTPSYSYLWSNGSIDQKITNAEAGIAYTVTVTDANGCTEMSTLTLAEPLALQEDNITTTDADCDSNETGSVDIDVIGGSGSLSYQISTGDAANSTGVFETLASGGYTYTVTDANNCILTGAFEIDDPSDLVLIVRAEIDEVCDENNDGAATVEAIGGTPGYTYNWSNSATGAMVTGLSAGTYTVTVTDAQGCTAIQTLEIEEPLNLVGNVIKIINETCATANNGSVTVVVDGGVPPYDFDFSDGAANDITGIAGETVASGLNADSYMVTITDANDCQIIIPFTVAQDANPVAVLNDLQFACTLSPSGNISLSSLLSSASTAGGVFTLSNISGVGASGSVVGNTLQYNGPGCYEITYVIDAVDGATGACTAMDIGYISIPEQPQPSFTIQNEICYSDGDTPLNLTPIVNSPTYLNAVVGDWSIVSETVTGAAVAINASNGIVTITDEAGSSATNGIITIRYTETIAYGSCGTLAAGECVVTFDATITVSDGTAIDASFTVSNEEPCPGELVTLTAATTGGVFTGPSVTDDGNGSTGSILVGGCGVYPITYTITTSSGCTNTFVYNLTTDETKPVLNLPTALIVECDGAGNAADLNTWLASVTGSDNCTYNITNRLFDTQSEACGEDVATFIYEFIAEDTCGNRTTGLSSFTILDITAPALVCVGTLPITLDATGAIMIDPSDVITSLTDICSDDSDIVVSISKTSFFERDEGPNTITVTATDDCGNSVSCDVVVEVSATPSIGLSKRVVNVKENPDGTALVTYEYNIENYGNVPLYNIQLEDTLTGRFGPCAIIPQGLTSGAFTINESYDGTNIYSLLTSNNVLDPQEKGSINLTILLSDCQGDEGPFINSATVYGETINGVPISDVSQNGANPDPEDDGPENNSDPTPVSFDFDSFIGISKAVDQLVINTDGTVDIRFEFTIQNYGDQILDTITAIDNLTGRFGGCDVNVISIFSSNFIENNSYDGFTDINLLEITGDNNLDPGEFGKIFVELELSNCGPTDTDFFNQALVSAYDPAGIPVVDDFSTVGNNPDPDGDNNPTNNDVPTPIHIGFSPEIGIAKRVALGPDRRADGCFDITYELKVENSGDLEIADVQIIEDLAATFAIADTFWVRGATSEEFNINPAFDGVTETSLLLGNDTLNVQQGGEEGSVLLFVTVCPTDLVETYNNSATVNATALNNQILVDVSDNGAIPDGDGNGNPNDDTDPTPVTVDIGPKLGLGKRVAEGPEANGDGSFDVVYELRTENLGNVNITIDSLIDSLSVTFADAAGFEVLSATSEEFEINPLYDGATIVNLINKPEVLAPGQDGAVLLKVRILPGGNPGPYFNIASVTGRTLSGRVVGDVSDNGTIGNGSGSTPTPIDLTCDNKIICPNEPDTIRQQNDFGWCTAIVNFELALADTCGGVGQPSFEYMLQGLGAEGLPLDTWIVGQPSGLPYKVGITDIQIRYNIPSQPALGYSDTCHLVVDVIDKQPAELLAGIPADIKLSCEEILDTFHLNASQFTDNCGDVTPVTVREVYCSSRDSIGCGQYTYSDTIKWYVLDGGGNEQLFTQVINWCDSDAPDINVPADTIISQCDSLSLNPISSGVAIAFDNCASPDEIIITFRDSLEVVCKGEKAGIIHRIWRAEDPCGNADSIIQKIIILDKNPPELNCKSTAKVSLGSNGTYTLQPSDVVESYFDACFNYSGANISNIAITIQPSFFDCGDIGTHEVLVSASDPCSNETAYCKVLVTVIDTIAPVLNCPTDTLRLDIKPGDCLVAIPALSNLIAGVDCDVDIITTPAIFDGLGRGVHDVLIVATDASGNADSCEVIVKIEGDPIDYSESMACRNRINVSLGTDCTARITPEMLLLSTEGICADLVCVKVTDDRGNEHANFFDISDNLQEFTVSIIDCNGSGNSCWGTVRIEEKGPPIIACPPDTFILCNEPTHPSFSKLGEPAILSCEDEYKITYQDEYIEFEKCEQVQATIIRSWRVEDENGNASTCVQRIDIMRFSFEHLWWPKDITIHAPLACEDVAADPTIVTPASTGRPTVFGLPVEDNVGQCLFSMNYEDEIFNICPGSYEILRTWKVRNSCTEAVPLLNPLEHIQVITVYDNTNPVLTGCPQDMTISTVPWACSYTGLLPVPKELSDACSDVTFDAYVSGGGYIIVRGDVNDGTIEITAIGIQKGEHFSDLYCKRWLP